MKNLAIFLLFIIVSTSLSVELRKYQNLLRGSTSDCSLRSQENCNEGGCHWDNGACASTKKKSSQSNCGDLSEQQCNTTDCEYNGSECVAKTPPTPPATGKRKRESDCSSYGNESACTGDLNCEYITNSSGTKVCQKKPSPPTGTRKRESDCSSYGNESACTGDSNCEYITNSSDTKVCQKKPSPPTGTGKKFK